MKNLSIFFMIFSLISCTVFNEGQLTERERYIMTVQIDMNNEYNRNRKPVFEIELPDGGTLPSGFKLSYYGEQDSPRLTIPRREYHPIWNVLQTAVPLGFGYLMTRENNNTWETIFKTAAQFNNNGNKQPTYSSGNNSPITIGNLDQSDSSIKDNSKITKTTETDTNITNTSTVSNNTEKNFDLDYTVNETNTSETNTTETTSTDSYNTENENLDFNYTVNEPIIPTPTP